jgi:hypothetical protein
MSVLVAFRGCAASVVVGEDLGLPADDRACQPRQLSDLGVGAALEEHDQLPAGVIEIVCGIDLAQQLFRQLRGTDLAVAVTDSGHAQHPHDPVVGQPVEAGEE